MHTTLNAKEWGVVLHVIIGINFKKYPESHPRGQLPTLPSTPIGLRGLRRKVKVLAAEYFDDTDRGDGTENAQFDLNLTLRERRALRYLLEIGPSLRPDLFDNESALIAIRLTDRL